MQALIETLLGQSYFYCVRRDDLKPFECVRYDNISFAEADARGLKHFEGHKGRSQILYYRRLWPNYLVQYFLRSELARTFHRLPTITNDETGNRYYD